MSDEETFEHKRDNPAILPRLGLAAGSAGWKAGHEAVRSGALPGIENMDDEAARDDYIAAYAAPSARAYMRQVVAANGLTEAEGARIFSVYMYTYIRGALDQALDGGALMRDH